MSSIAIARPPWRNCILPTLIACGTTRAQAGEGQGEGTLPDETYTYDANGNRTMPGYVIGAGNRLLSDGTYQYAYDAEGNRTARFIDFDGSGTLTDGDSDITEYAWDVRNRLASVTTYATYGGPATQIVGYRYDTRNRWIGETIDADGDGTIDHETRFVHDGHQIALQFDKARAAGSASALTAADLSHRYLWGPAVDQLLSDERTQLDGNGNLASDELLWALGDQLGTVRDLAICDTATGVTGVANHRDFDSFGNLKAESNAALDCLIGFQGRPESATTELRNQVNRWTDPGTGNWLSTDPDSFHAGDTNLYRHCGNVGTALLDPSGLAESEWMQFTSMDGKKSRWGRVISATDKEVTILYKGDFRTTRHSIDIFWPQDQYYFKQFMVPAPAAEVPATPNTRLTSNVPRLGLNPFGFIRDQSTVREPSENQYTSPLGIGTFTIKAYDLDAYMHMEGYTNATVAGYGVRFYTEYKLDKAIGVSEYELVFAKRMFVPETNTLYTRLYNLCDGTRDSKTGYLYSKPNRLPRPFPGEGGSFIALDGAYGTPRMARRISADCFPFPNFIAFEGFDIEYIIGVRSLNGEKPLLDAMKVRIEVRSKAGSTKLSISSVDPKTLIQDLNSAIAAFGKVH